jgi:hypothetical protein
MPALKNARPSCIGSSLDSFLKEEGIFDEVTAEAVNRVNAWRGENALRTYLVSWSEDDGEFVGACAEFPSLSHLDADREAAMRGIRGLVADVVREAGLEASATLNATASQP